MWQQLSNAEEISMGAEIDAQDQFNRHAGFSISMAKVSLSFYPGAQLIRVTSRQVSLGDKYFIRHGEKMTCGHSTSRRRIATRPICSGRWRNGCGQSQRKTLRRGAN